MLERWLGRVRERVSGHGVGERNGCVKEKSGHGMGEKNGHGMNEGSGCVKERNGYRVGEKSSHLINEKNGCVKERNGQFSSERRVYQSENEKIGQQGNESVNESVIKQPVNESIKNQSSDEHIINSPSNQQETNQPPHEQTTNTIESILKKPSQSPRELQETAASIVSKYCHFPLCSNKQSTNTLETPSHPSSSIP